MDDFLLVAVLYSGNDLKSTESLDGAGMHIENNKERVFINSRETMKKNYTYLSELSTSLLFLHPAVEDEVVEHFPTAGIFHH